MKKILFALICIFFTATSFASLKLTGVISDSLNSATKLEGVKITLGGKSKPPSIGKGIYTIPNFDKVKNGDVLTFTHEEYEDLTGTIVVGINGPTKFKTSKKDYDITAKIVGDVWDNETLELNVFLNPLPVPIISGTVTGEGDKGAKGVKVTAYDYGNSGFEEIDTTDGDGFYEIKGHLGTAENPRKYKLLFESNKYETKDKYIDNIEVKTEIITGQDIQLSEIDLSYELEQNMVEMTGFACSETMPKYLVGASCNENKQLKGDASDIALWIQKFGGKITSLIGMIAVVLIVWNAFVLATSAGDTDKVSQGKKGILWTILGLAVTMFAYLIVKTVIVLMYTQ